MNRKDFQKLAGEFVAESKILFDAGKYGGAYYLAGYSVECAIKACIAKKTRRHDFPARRTDHYYSHKIEGLLIAAGLQDEINKVLTNDLEFAVQWGIVKLWTEESRYERRRRPEAKGLYLAIVDEKYGVLPWIKHHW